MPTYLIHLDQPFHHARHYTGFSEDVFRRLCEHKMGIGSKLLKAVNEAGIGWHVVKIWPDGRGRERYMKRQKNGPRFCPVCNPK